MIAIDTNVLVYAHREELPQHEAARSALVALVSGAGPFGIPLQVGVEFVRVVTHPRLFRPPSSRQQALDALDALTSRENARRLLPGPRFWPLFARQLEAGGATGNLVFDAAIAAVCIEHGAELVTADRDFARFPDLRVRPLAGRTAPG